MWISRVRITGGFLNGLDVTLCNGLNVVIGPRGVGKTTFLELLRHALGAQHADQGSARQRQSFLSAVLGSGEVVVDIESDDGGRHLVVDAKGGGQRSDLSSSVVVLGQNELEEIASDAPSRLNLLDLRVGNLAALPESSEVKDITGDLFELRESLRDRQEESSKRVTLVNDRQLLEAQEQALVGERVEQLAAQREELRIAEEKVVHTGQELNKIEVVRAEAADVLSVQDRQTIKLESINQHFAALDAFVVRESPVPATLEHSRVMSKSLSTVLQALEEVSARTKNENIAAREQAAPIREELERAEAGLGQVTSQLRNIDTELRALDENDKRVREIKANLVALVNQRSEILDRVELVEEEIYRNRSQVARDTTAQIANDAVVVVDHLADSSKFRSLLTDALKGSNTRSTVVDVVAEQVLPRQLLEFIESRDGAGLAAVSEFSIERSQKLIENLNKKQTLQDLASVRLEDSVDFRLRDGVLDKSVDELSTGQKCAVTLPIVLSERERTLILDQPEDHLDNAFLVTNIVTGLVARSENNAQTIVATHNANIPVLGSAETAVVLTSDGRTGSVDVVGRFDKREIVNRITRLMEGGQDAFARRASFYAEYGSSE